MSGRFKCLNFHSNVICIKFSQNIYLAPFFETFQPVPTVYFCIDERYESRKFLLFEKTKNMVSVACRLQQSLKNLIIKDKKILVALMHAQ